MTRKEILVTFYYECIQFDLEFISLLKSQTWAEPFFNSKRNEVEEKERKWYIEKSKKNIEFYKAEIKTLTS